LGCGTGDVIVRFVEAFPAVTALGVDGSAVMLEYGRSRVRGAGLESRITLERRYLPDATLERRQFDAVITNSLLHHVTDPVALWRTAALCAKPEAPVLFVDLLRPASHEEAVRLVHKHASDAPPVLERDFIASLHAAYALDEVREQLCAADLKHFQVEQVDELHFIGWGHGTY
jgi:SAM-dependent methyltransferase